MILHGGGLVDGIDMVIGAFAVLAILNAPTFLQLSRNIVRHFNEFVLWVMRVVASQVDNCHSDLLEMTRGTSRHSSLSLPVMEQMPLTL